MKNELFGKTENETNWKTKNINNETKSRKMSLQKKINMIK